MSASIRFLFDEHLSKSVARRLRAVGVDAVTVAEVHRRKRPDIDQMRYAMAEGRAIVTCDTDYIDLGIQFQNTGEPFAGVVYCIHSKYKKKPKQLFNDLLILHGVLTPEDMQNHIEFLK